MAKDKEAVAWHLTVWPEDISPYQDIRRRYPSAQEREGAWRRACEELQSAIRRHVDGVETVLVESDNRGRCEFCGTTWTEDGDAYNGGCCDEDEKSNPAPED